MAFLLNNRAKVATTSFLLFCFSLFLTAYSARNPEIARIGFTFLAEIQRPFQMADNSVNSSITDFWEGYINLINVKEQNQALQDRVNVLEALNSSMLEFKSENQRLKKLLGVIEDQKINAIAANVIGYDPTGISQTVILDQGSEQGVKNEMPVLVGDGVVGQVVEVSLNTSRALLITDPSSGIDAIVQGSRVRGIVRGTAGSSQCELLYVLREDEIKVGDRIITSGMDQIFPKGLLIGIVSNIENRKAGMFQSVDVKTSVNFNKLENLLIVIDKGNKP